MPSSAFRDDQDRGVLGGGDTPGEKAEEEQDAHAHSRALVGARTTRDTPYALMVHPVARMARCSTRLASSRTSPGQRYVASNWTFFLMIRPPRRTTLFLYTTLFCFF